MKWFFSLVVLFVSIFETWAQSFSGPIPVLVQVEGKGFDQEEVEYLKTRIGGLIASSDFVAIDYCDRLVVLVKYTLVSNHITTASPATVLKKYDLSIFVGDVIDNKVFGVESITISGLGETDKKANKSAISSMKSNNPKLHPFFCDIEAKMVDYYSSNEQLFITKAHDMASLGHFEEGIAYLMSIPQVDESRTRKCRDFAIELYTAMVDKTSWENYRSAKAAWIANKNKEGAQTALSFLKKVDIGSSCYKESLSLWNEISKRLDENEIVEKDTLLLEYRDKVAFRTRLLNACEQIGIAFCQNRPKQVTKIVGLW